MLEDVLLDIIFVVHKRLGSSEINFAPNLIRFDEEEGNGWVKRV